MNSKFLKGNRIPLHLLLQTLLCIGLIAAVYAIVVGNPMSGDAASQDKINSTKTAFAMTSAALLGPFPTATVPTATASAIPTYTSTLPTATPTVTRTPTRTLTPIQSPVPRTREAEPRIPVVPTSVPPTSIPPTNGIPTNPPPPTEKPPTEVPTEAPIQPPIIDVPPIIETIVGP